MWPWFCVDSPCHCSWHLFLLELKYCVAVSPGVLWLVSAESWNKIQVFFRGVWLNLVKLSNLVILKRSQCCPYYSVCRGFALDQLWAGPCPCSFPQVLNIRLFPVLSVLPGEKLIVLDFQIMHILSQSAFSCQFAKCSLAVSSVCGRLCLLIPA